MDKNRMLHLLKNYVALLARVDDHIQKIEARYPEKIACKKGCDACCRFLTLFPVEAIALSNAFIKLPQDLQQMIEKKIQNKDGTCPLLIEKACLLYPERPIICRTHGYPIYMGKKGKALVDFCPKNFKGMTSFPKDSLLSIDQLNTTLTTVNRHFIDSFDTESPFPDRIPVSNALLLLKKIL